MQAKEIIEKLKLTFNELVNQPTPVALMDATLADGTPVKITELAVGGIVTINDQPAPAGEHLLSDGTKIYVGENGAITEIEAPEEVPAALAAEDMGAKFSAFESVTNEKFQATKLNLLLTKHVLLIMKLNFQKQQLSLRV